MHTYELTLVGGTIITFKWDNVMTHLRMDLAKGYWPQDQVTGEVYNPAHIVRIKHVKYAPPA